MTGIGIDNGSAVSKLGVGGPTVVRVLAVPPSDVPREASGLMQLLVMVSTCGAFSPQGYVRPAFSQANVACNPAAVI